MTHNKKIRAGWITIVCSFVLSIVIIGILGPDTDLSDACDQMKEDGGGENDLRQLGCDQVDEDNETTAAWFAATCMLPSTVGVILLVIGFNERTSDASTAVVIQSPAYMMPAQATYAVPVVQQQTQSDLDAQLKQQRMQNVELLRADGRLMEAALEAEQAGEYSYASELRTQAENKLRINHQPQTNNEDTYLAYLTTALADGFLSLQEEELLESQRNQLGVSWEVHTNMLASAGYSHDNLKLLQNAKTMEDSGRFLESAALYETAGNLDKSQMLRMRAQMLNANPSSVTYNISDSAVSGNIGSNNLDDIL